ncbi:conserved protein of unknown function [Methylacidimicrobium sp. AP8]|nr:conserved protein of unknown function [Methylacidimicrobium sp. AP8]
MTQVRENRTASAPDGANRNNAWMASLALFCFWALALNGATTARAEESSSAAPEATPAGSPGSATEQGEQASGSSPSEATVSGSSSGAEPAAAPSSAAAPAGRGEAAAPSSEGTTGAATAVGAQGPKEAMAPQEAFGPKTGLYFGIFGGAAFGMSNGVSALDSPPLFSAGGRATPGTAAVGGVEVGYNFRSFALDSAKSYWLQPAAQFEAFYLGQATERGTLTGGVAGTPAIAPYQFGSNLNMGVFLVDGVAKFVTPIGLVPYIGGGIGGAYLASSGTSFTGPTGNLLTTGGYEQGAFAGQGLVGLQYNISEHWSIFAEYKILYIKETQFSYLMTSGNTMLIKYPEYYNIAIAGLRFNF